MAQLDASLPPCEVKIFYLQGEGGIGKTRLLQEALKAAQRKSQAGKACVVFSEPVDFYHYPTHTLEGLAQAIQKVLPEAVQSRYFYHYEELLRLGKNAQQRGDIEGAETLRKEALQEFKSAFEDLTQNHALVMAFDTLESLGRVDPENHLLGWLLELINVCPVNGAPQSSSSQKRVTLLLAGRPHATVDTFLKKKNIDPLAISSLSPEAVTEYLERLVEALREQRQDRLAQRLQALTTPELTETMHLLTGGRPILIALAAEILLSESKLPAIFSTSPSELRTLDSEVLQAKGREAIITHLWTLREPWRSTLALLALTRKGMSAALLSALQGISPAEAESRLERLSRLSLIKPRLFEGEQRVFLHDELYALLESNYPNPETRVNTLRAITEWYEKERKDLIDKIRQAHKGREKEPTDVDLEQAYRRLEQLKIEQVHYALRADWREGLAKFVDYDLETFTTWQLTLDPYLQSEVYEYLEQHCESPEARAALAWELTLAQIRRHILNQQLDEAQQLLATLEASKAPRTVHRVHRDIWEGVLATEKGEYETAEACFCRAESTLKEVPEGLLKLRLKAVLYNSWGYALRLQYKNRRAAEMYSRAITPLRRLDNRYELADLHKNQAFCLAESGRTHEAKLLISDALELAQQEGATYLEGLAWNTKALILIRDGQPREALSATEKALKLFQELSNKRGQGLAYLALANAYRRLALHPDTEPAKQREYNEQARNMAEAAVKIFEDYPELVRKAEAWTETGCAYRDRVLIEHQSYNVPLSWLRLAPDLADKGRGFFERTIASPAPAYYQIDARINLALLELYLENFDQVEPWLLQAEGLVPEVNRLRAGGPYPPKGEESYWLALGKLYQVRAQLLWRQGEANFPQVIECLTLSQAYDELFDPQAYGTTRAQSDLHRALKKLPHDTLQSIYRRAWQTAAKYNLPRSRSNPQQRTLLLRFLEDYFGFSEDDLSPEELESWSTP